MSIFQKVFRPSKKNGLVPASEGPYTFDEASVLKKLSKIIDPDLKQDIVSAGFIQNLVLTAATGTVTFDLVLTTPACPIKEKFKSDCERLLLEIPDVKKVQLTLDAQKPVQKEGNNANPLARVRNIIAVASGKGGVGKSTTAVHLAYTLKKLGARVGVVDADIYGPSIQKMTGADRPKEMKGDFIVPPVKDGIKFVSGAMFCTPEKAQVLRGPMAGNLVKQFLTQIDWQDLDYLIIDYPPGTGDIQLTLSQIAQIDAAVLVTTPQQVATADVMKAVDMFATLQVPIAGIIENMSYFSPPNSDEKFRIFGEGGAKKLAKTYGFPILAQIPIEPAICEQADKGGNLISNQASSETATLYQEAADQLVRSLATWKHSESEILKSFQLKWRRK